MLPEAYENRGTYRARAGEPISVVTVLNEGEMDDEHAQATEIYRRRAEKLDIDEETITDTAAWYDLENVVAAMYRGLRGEYPLADRPDVLPREAEYMALKEQYGVP